MDQVYHQRKQNWVSLFLLREIQYCQYPTPEKVETIFPLAKTSIPVVSGMDEGFFSPCLISLLQRIVIFTSECNPSPPLLGGNGPALVGGKD